MDRYELLAALHHRIRPRGYLEVGVETGASLRLAHCPALGIDPDPHLRGPLAPQHRVAVCESDLFFGLPRARQHRIGLPDEIDLAFVDGLHHYDQVLRDIAGIEALSHPRTVIAVDDVLPRNQAEASRVRTTVDWTGDVWKVVDLLRRHRPDLSLTVYDTAPTGVLVITGLDPGRYWHLPEWVGSETVPPSVLLRVDATAPDDLLAVAA